MIYDIVGQVNLKISHAIQHSVFVWWLLSKGKDKKWGFEHTLTR